MKVHRRPSRRGRLYPVAIAAIALSLSGPTPGSTQDLEPALAASIDVFVPEVHNLQWMNLWVALGAGLFVEEGLNVKAVLPAQSDEDNALGALRALSEGSADIAVLPRPMFLTAVARGRPVLAFANLLRNDPINLVVHGHIAEERGLSPTLPLADRLAALRGLRIGVAPGPLPRLRALLATANLDPDRYIETVIVPGEAQNQSFGQGHVDALYAHTPYLETALVEQDGVLIVNQSAGEVHELANRQIHMLVTTQEYAATNPDVLIRVVRAIHRAQRLIHTDREATLTAIRRSVVELQAPGALETLVEIYEPAIPYTPEVSPDGALRELELFPARREVPDLSTVDMTKFVDNRFVERALASE